MSSAKKIKGYRDRMAHNYVCTHFPNAMEYAHSNSYKIGFSAALELGKALGRAEALQAAAKHAHGYWGNTVKNGLREMAAKEREGIEEMLSARGETCRDVQYR